MAKNTLPVDFKDDVLNEQMGGRRKYRMINNPDGTVSFEDVTTYDQTGSNFGQAQINATNQAVNESADKATVIDEQADLMANTQEGMIAGALAVKELISEQNANLPKFMDFEIVIPSDEVIAGKDVGINSDRIIAVSFVYNEILYHKPEVSLSISGTSVIIRAYEPLSGARPYWIRVAYF